MIERLRTLRPLRRHPRPRALTRYLDGDLDASRRRALETHLRDCTRCRRELGSLVDTLGALGSLEAESPPGLADSIIAALRVEPAAEPVTRRGAASSLAQPLLTVVPAGEPAEPKPILSRWREEIGVALRWCLRRRQLRLTLPITVVAGVVISLVNMGGTLLHGRIDVNVCLNCAIDFLVPFLALNLGLLMLVRLPRRRRL